MRMTTLSSGLITAQALTSGVASSAADGSTEKPSARPAPAAAVPTTKERRSSRGESNLGIWFMAAFPLRFGRRRVDRGANALIGSATADVGDRAVDVVVGRF